MPLDRLMIGHEPGSMSPRITDRRSGRAAWPVLAVVAVIVLAGAAWLRMGVLNLPSVPSGLTAQQVGLADLADLKRLDDALRGVGSLPDTALSPAGRRVRRGLAHLAAKNVVQGLEAIREALRMEPENLVFANLYRMEVFRLRQLVVLQSHVEATPVPVFPSWLDRQPIVFFEELSRQHPCRETSLHLALAWVDEMLLFPALEIKAPASVEAVRILSSILDGRDPEYVPALFARGMNHLHRPVRLVWPEADKYPPDSAARDLARCVAIGRKVGFGSPRLQARLALALGDAYVKSGRYGAARSWWQIAQNLCRDADVREAVRLRFSWRDENLLDRLEEQLDRDRSKLDRPMTDLSFMWSDE